MKHPSYDPTCGICHSNAGEEDSAGGVIFENDLWFIRHTGAPFPLAGWLLLQPQRHVQGPARFTDEEAANFGPALRHFMRTLEIVTGAPRSYVVAYGESVPHMHAHIIPRYADLPDPDVAWGLADRFRAIGDGSREGIPEAEVMEVIEAYKAALAENPPPN